MNARENILRAARFERPESIPVHFAVSPACWSHYDPGALADLMEARTLLFPNFRRAELPARRRLAPWHRAGVPYTDSWGCLWQTATDGLTGAVTRGALPNWSAFERFTPPDAAEQDGWGPVDWDGVAQGFARAAAQGRLKRGSLRHGHTFMTLMYIRGYENLLYDMADEEPRLPQLVEMVERFNASLVRRLVDLGAEWIGYPEDLGMQRGPMLSPEQFRRWILPVYRRLMEPARRARAVVHMHSDGDIRELADDLLACGADVLNLQDLVNGVDWIGDNLKGRVCIDLDIDRQRITRFGTPDEIDRHIRGAVERLGSPRGGLMLTHGLYPGVPLENVRATMDAMQRYATMFS